MADYFEKIRGIIGALFQLGVSGPQLKDNSGAIEARNSNDSAYAVLRGAAPVSDNDLATKKYVDSVENVMIVSRQADCSVAIPNNTATRGFVVVSTAGSGAAIGDVLYDNGSSTGQMEILAAVEGRTIAITDSLTGGTVTFEADSIYLWDSDGSSWLKISDIGSVTGAERVLRFILNNSATQDSVFQIPANARVLEVSLEITTAYSGGATISIGNTATANLLMATTDNVPQNVNRRYVIPQDTLWPSLSVVRATVGGTPAAGAAVVIVKFSTPLA